MADPVYLSVGDVWAINDLILRAEGQTSLLQTRTRWPSYLSIWGVQSPDCCVAPHL